MAALYAALDDHRRATVDARAETVAALRMLNALPDDQLSARDERWRQAVARAEVLDVVAKALEARQVRLFRDIEVAVREAGKDIWAQ